MSQDDELWHVQLDSAHPDYQSVALRRRPGHTNYEVVEVDAEKLIHYSNQDIRGYVIAPVEYWQPDKRQGIFNFLAPPGPREQPVEMPVISFNERDVFHYERKWLFFKKAVQLRLKYIGYTNGRHRSRYLYYAGAKRIPVMCHISEVDALKAHCAPQ